MKKRPPKYAIRFLHWFCDPDIVDDIEGDLLERFEHRLHQGKPANRLFLLDVLQLVRPGIVRVIKAPGKSGNLAITGYFLKISLRNLSRANGFAIMSILGFSMALAAGFLICQYVVHEHQTDSFFTHRDQLFRVVREVEEVNASYRSPYLAAPYRDVLIHSKGIQEDHLVRLYQDDELVSFENKHFFEAQFFYADPAFFKLLDFPFQYGHPGSSLNDPNAVVISQEVAKRYFGNINPLGKLLHIDNKGPLKVTGVLAQLPANSHLDLAFVAPIQAMGYTSRMLKEKEAHAFSFYLLAEDGVLPTEIPGIKPHTNITWQAVTDIYFDPLFEMDMARHGNRQLLQSMILTAILILVIGGANFLNFVLSTIIKDLKGLGLRKILGSHWKKEVIKQLADVYLMVNLATVLAMIMSYLLSAFVLTTYHIPFRMGIDHLWLLPLFTLIITVVFGLYPAMIFSGTSITEAMAKKVKKIKIRSLQDMMLTFQFVIVLLLMVLSLVVTKQFAFLQNKSLGLNPEQILYFSSNNKDSFRNMAKIKMEMEALSGVSDVAMSIGGLPHSFTESISFKVPEDGTRKQIMTVFASRNFPELMELSVVEGQLFNTKIRSTASRTALVNETAARQLGWPQQKLIGTPLQPVDYFDSLEGPSWNIVGIVDDFHFESFRKQIEPLIILSSDLEETFIVKLASQDAGKTVDQIAAIWNNHVPNYPFTYFFLDQRFQQIYEDDTRQRKMLYLFSGLAILIAIIGLTSISAYILQRRRKEMALRNVLGAPHLELIRLLSARYFKLLGIATIISLPVSIYLSNLWLSEFSYRTSLSANLFWGSSLVVAAVMLAVLFLQIQRSLSNNPAEELSHE